MQVHKHVRGAQLEASCKRPKADKIPPADAASECRHNAFAAADLVSQLEGARNQYSYGTVLSCVEYGLRYA